MITKNSLRLVGIKLLLLWLVYIISPNPLLSQNKLSYQIDKITYDNGESIGHTRKIVFDSTGVMWITGRGTGLHSYDGRKVITHHVNSSAHFFPLEQSVLAFNKRDGNFIISDWHEQLYSYNPYLKQITDSTTFENIEGMESGMYEFLIDSLENIWAVTWAHQRGGTSVIVIRGREGESLKKIDTIGISSFPQLIEHKNHIYYTSNESIKAYNRDGSFYKNYPLKDEGFSVSPFGLCSDNQGNLWVKSDGKKTGIQKSASIFKLNELTQEFELFEVKNKEILYDAHSIQIIGDDIWVGGFNEKLIRISLKTGEQEDYTLVLRNLSKKSIYITNFFEDSYGVIWITSSQGLFKLTKKEEPKYSIYLDKKEGFCDENCIVQSIKADQDNIYVSYLSSLVKMNKKTRKVTKVPFALDEMKLGTSRSVIWDDGAEKLSLFKDNLIWHDRSLNLKSKTIEELIPNLPDFRSVNKVIGKDKLWVVPYYATDIENELHIYDLVKKTYTTHSSQIEKDKSEHPHAILESKFHDKVWVSYFRRGILEFDKEGKFGRNFKPFNPEKIVLFNAMLEDKNGILWAGTTVGLIEINPVDYSYKIHKNLTASYQGKVNNKGIKSMVFINDSIIWIGGYSGVQVFNSKAKQYCTPDLPLELREVEASASAIYYDTNSSTIYLGTKRGLVLFNPFSIVDTTLVNSEFPILISNYSVYNSVTQQRITNNSVLANIDRIELNPNDVQIEMDYILPNFPGSNQLLYSHKLEGYDVNWSLPSVSNGLKYNKLPPGDYVLKLRVGTDVNNMNRFTKSIRLTVYQVWYKKNWFIVLCFILFIGLVVLILQVRFKQKLNKELELERLRTKISTDLHDDVGSILTGLAMQTEIMERQANQDQKSKLARVSELSRSAMLRMRDAVWTMDARKDNWKSLIDRMNEFISETLEVKKITYEFKQEGIELEAKIDTLLRQNLYLVFKEAIANILKHSDADRVYIELAKVNGVLSLEIKDNGTPKKKFSTAGLGLTNMKMRADQMKANLIVRAEDGFSIKVIVNK